MVTGMSEEEIYREARKRVGERGAQIGEAPLSDSFPYSRNLLMAAPRPL